MEIRTCLKQRLIRESGERADGKYERAASPDAKVIKTAASDLIQARRLCCVELIAMFSWELAGARGENNTTCGIFLCHSSLKKREKTIVASHDCN